MVKNFSYGDAIENNTLIANIMIEQTDYLKKLLEKVESQDEIERFDSDLRIEKAIRLTSETIISMAKEIDRLNNEIEELRK